MLSRLGFEETLKLPVAYCCIERGLLVCSGFGVEAVYLLLYGWSEIYPFVLLLVSGTNTDSIWLGFMETLESSGKRLGLPLLGIVNSGWVAHNRASWQSRMIGEINMITGWEERGEREQRQEVIRADDSRDNQIPTIRNYFDSSGLVAPLVSWSFEVPTSSDTDSIVACLICSPSEPVACSLVLVSLVSFSSSLSPRLNGSFSATGEGSTVDNGCHLLALPLVELRRLDGVDAS